MLGRSANGQESDQMGSVDGFASVGIVSAGGAVQAEFVPDANMVCRSLTHRGVHLLHAGHGVQAYAERGKTMGIPLLHPWANRLAAPAYRAAGKEVTLPPAEGRYGLDPNGLPIHGALPGRLRWQVEPAPAEDRISARLDWSDADLLELFPFVHELQIDARVTDSSLEVITTLRATGDDGVPVSFGYHPYLHLSGSPRDDWQVTLGAADRLLLDDRMIPTGASEPLASRSFRLGEQSWDDGLSALSTPPEFSVAAAGHRLTLTFETGFSFAQVYAPPGQDFICFEPMTAPTNALISGDGLTSLAPGQEHRTAFVIAVADN
jgi:aldose 1-epimerase